MNYFIVFIICTSTNLAFARLLFQSNSSNEIKETETIKVEHSQASSKKSVQTQVRRKKAVRRGNLPSYSRISQKLDISVEGGSITNSGGIYRLENIYPGDEFEIAFDTLLYGLEGEQVKVTGYVLSGDLIGYRAIGHTILEPFSKRLMVKFTHLINNNGEKFEFTGKAKKKNSYSLKPTKYVSKKNQFLLKHVLSAFAASFLETRVSSTPNVFGGNTIENNFESSSYKAASDGVKVVSNDFKRALSESKDVAYINSKLNFKLVVLEQPKFLKNSN